ncbi:MAG: ISL3 family transposase, partial [Thermoleophilaceae bacterium]
PRSIIEDALVLPIGRGRHAALPLYPFPRPEWTLGRLTRESRSDVKDANRRLFRAFLLKEELRLLYHLDDPRQAPEHLAAWLAWASRSKLKPFVKLARTIRRHRDGILAAIRLGLSNGRLEGLNSKIRLISHRSFGFHSATPLIALVYLCCGGLVVTPPLA